MLFLIFLQGSTRERWKPITDLHLSLTQLHAPYDLVAAETSQNDTFWDVTAGLELLSKMQDTGKRGSRGSDPSIQGLAAPLLK